MREPKRLIRLLAVTLLDLIARRGGCLDNCVRQLSTTEVQVRARRVAAHLDHCAMPVDGRAKWIRAGLCSKSNNSGKS
jgi:hypothetical protein